VVELREATPVAPTTQHQIPPSGRPGPQMWVLRDPRSVDATCFAISLLREEPNVRWKQGCRTVRIRRIADQLQCASEKAPSVRQVAARRRSRCGFVCPMTQGSRCVVWRGLSQHGIVPGCDANGESASARR
jgi:hypothetical protein